MSTASFAVKTSVLAVGALYVTYKYMTYRAEKEHQEMVKQMEMEALSKKRKTYLKLTGATVLTAGAVYLALKTRAALQSVKETITEGYTKTQQV